MRAENFNLQKFQEGYSYNFYNQPSMAFSSNNKTDEDRFCLSEKIKAPFSIMQKLRTNSLAIVISTIAATLGGYSTVHQKTIEQEQNQKILNLQADLNEKNKILKFLGVTLVQQEFENKAANLKFNRLEKEINKEIKPYTFKNLEKIAKKASPSTVVIVDSIKNLETNESANCLGTGFIISPNLILTNAHILELEKDGDNYFPAIKDNGPSVILIKVPYMKEPIQLTEKNIVAKDSMIDLAVIKLPDNIKLPDTAKPLKLSDKKIQQGEYVATMGTPEGFFDTFTTGVISNIKRTFKKTKENTEEYVEYIQTDAAINIGNSGGPLLDHNGEVIGINTMIIENSEGLSFSINIPTVRRFLEKYNINID